MKNYLFWTNNRTDDKKKTRKKVHQKRVFHNFGCFCCESFEWKVETRNHFRDTFRYPIRVELKCFVTFRLSSNESDGKNDFLIYNWDCQRERMKEMKSFVSEFKPHFLFWGDDCYLESEDCFDLIKWELTLRRVKLNWDCFAFRPTIVHWSLEEIIPSESDGTFAISSASRTRKFDWHFYWIRFNNVLPSDLVCCLRPWNFRERTLKPSCHEAASNHLKSFAMSLLNNV